MQSHNIRAIRGGLLGVVLLGGLAATAITACGDSESSNTNGGDGGTDGSVDIDGGG